MTCAFSPHDAKITSAAPSPLRSATTGSLAKSQPAPGTVYGQLPCCVLSSHQAWTLPS